MTREEILASATYKELEAALNVQREAFIKNMYPSEEVRRDRIRRVMDATKAYGIKIAEAIEKDYGVRAPLFSVMMDVMFNLEPAEFILDHLHEWMQPVIPKLSPANEEAGFKAEIFRQPCGVVGIAGPWNFPYQLSFGIPLLYVLAGGNSAMLKLSSKTPNCSQVIIDICKEYFSPEEVVAYCGTGDFNDAFCSLPFDKLLLTGSPRVGKEVMAKAAHNLVPLVLELGGKNPVILGEEADLDYSVEMIWGQKLLNSGQACTDVDHVYIPAHMLEDFISKSKEVVHTMIPTVLGNPFYTSIINESNYQRLYGYVKEAEAMGVRCERMTAETEDISVNPLRQLPPHIIVDPTPNMKVFREEIFGPVLLLKTYTDIDEVFDIINHGEHPLGLYYFGSDEKNINRAKYQTVSGAVAINDINAQCFDTSLPFGGVGTSGLGKYRGISGYETFTVEKTIVTQNPANPGRKATFPPYTAEIQEAYINEFLASNPQK